MAQIDKPNLHFNTVTYTGNGSTNAITGVGFQPDFVWIKNRSNTSSHNVFDAVRGATKAIFTNATDAEYTEASRLSAFNSDGFTINGDTSNQTNANGSNFVSFNWKANGAGSANTDGATSSTVSVNTTAGFSIVKYTGTGSQTTVGHGLGVVPDMMIIRNLSSTEDWSVYHSANGAGKYQAINTTEASSSNNNRFNVAPTSSVFTVNTHHSVNKSGDNHIAYCFAEKKGYSKFDSYTGNGSADGTFVYTGFKPAFVLTKNASSTSEWHIYDNKRDTDNPNSNVLSPNANYSDSISSNCDTDFLSNGFKLRNSNSNRNENGSTHIYMAFAENPIVGSNNIPATAR